mgnify:CR=1 FL=1
MELTVAITGASGAIYAHKTLVHLAASGVVERINLIVSDSARTVAMVELGFDLRSADEKRSANGLGCRPRRRRCGCTGSIIWRRRRPQVRTRSWV